jgi:hypothetical protein
MRVKRRCLHVAAAMSWGMSACLLFAGIQVESHGLRLLLMFMLTVAATFTSSALLVALLAPMPAVYRAGFRDGAESRDERPKLTVVRDERAVGESRWF